MVHKKRAALAALLAAALAALLLFTGCSAAVYADLRPGWQTNSDYDAEFTERMTYSLSYESLYESDDTGWRVTLDEANSSYTTTAEALRMWQAPDGETHYSVYHIRSVLTVSATYSFVYSDGSQEEIVSFGGDEADSVVTDVYFHSLAAPTDNEKQHSLEPIYSKNVVRSHTPAGFSSDVVSWYNYTSEIAYNSDGTSAKLSFTDGWGELSDEDRKVSDHVAKISLTNAAEMGGEYKGLRDSNSAFDNAQFYFLARGLSYTNTDDNAQSSTAVTMLSETAGAQSASIACKDRANINCSFLFSSTNRTTGTTTVSRLNTDIYAAEVSLSLTGSQTASGAARTVYIAQEAGYFNVPLRMEVPFTYSAGTITYSLKSFSHAE